jgi:hypothetical protein
MRQDIEIHINTGDVTLSPVNTPTLYPFRWVDNPDGLTRYAYGEATLPAIIGEQQITGNGFCVNIPYTPRYKEFCIRIKRTLDGDRARYLTNPTDGSPWFVVQAGLYGHPPVNIRASQLPLIADDAYYRRLSGGIARLFSALSVDLRIIDANRQNANLLLKCVPGNNYRYPLTGVGLIRQIKSNMNRSRLSETLQREFERDGVSVRNASYDFDTGNLYLDLDTNDTRQ